MKHYGLLTTDIKIGKKLIEIQYINHYPLIETIIYSAHLSNLIDEPESIIADFNIKSFLAYLDKYKHEHLEVFDIENYFQSFPELQLLEIYATLWILMNKCKKIVELIIIDELGVVLYNFCPGISNYEQICIYKKDNVFYPAIIKEKIYNVDGKVIIRKKQGNFLEKKNNIIDIHDKCDFVKKNKLDKQIFDELKFLFC